MQFRVVAPILGDDLGATQDGTGVTTERHTVDNHGIEYSPICSRIPKQRS